MELSTTSQIRWCSPRGPVEPMYIPVRIRTASSPSRTVIDDAPYSLGPLLLALLLASATCELLASRGSGTGPVYLRQPSRGPRARPALTRMCHGARDRTR